MVCSWAKFTVNFAVNVTVNFTFNFAVNFNFTVNFTANFTTKFTVNFTPDQRIIFKGIKKLDCEDVNCVSLVQDKDCSFWLSLMDTVHGFKNINNFKYVNNYQLFFK